MTNHGPETEHERNVRMLSQGYAEGMSRFANASSDFLATLDRTWFAAHWKALLGGLVVLVLAGPALALLGFVLGWHR